MSNTEIVDFKWDGYHFRGASLGSWETGILVFPYKIQFDAGVFINESIKYLMVTHGHYDHVKRFGDIIVNNSETLQVFSGKRYLYPLREWMKQLSRLNFPEGKGSFNRQVIFNEIGFDQLPGIPKITLNHGKEIIEIKAIPVPHSIPCQAYAMSRTTKKLKPEYQSLDKVEIAELVKSGTTVTQMETSKYLLYATDFNASGLELLGIENFPMVILECTFFSPEDKVEAVKRDHLHWDDIKPYVMANPKTKFLLIHPSRKYYKTSIPDDTIAEFTNVKLFK